MLAAAIRNVLLWTEWSPAVRECQTTLMTTVVLLGVVLLLHVTIYKELVLTAIILEFYFKILLLISYHKC